MKHLKEDDFLINQINRRIDYLNYTSSKIKIYGYKSATKECKELSLYSRLSCDDTNKNSIRNLNIRETDIIFERCLQDSFFIKNKMTKEKLTYNGALSLRRNTTKCRAILSCLLNELGSCSPTNIGGLLNRSRQAIHNYMKEIESCKNSKSKEDIELYSTYIRIKSKTKKELSKK